MFGPLNPANWFRATQDWFAKTELSSGFKPYLAYLLICIPAGLILIAFGHFFSENFLKIVGAILVIVPILYFIPLYTWKAKTDREFCRSEKHVETMRHIELEAMGSKSHQIPGDVYEALPDQESVSDPLVLAAPTSKVEKGDEP